MKHLISFFFFINILSWSQAQLIYYSTIQSTVGIDNIATIGIFDLGNCTREELYVDTTDHLIGYIEWIDIALCPDGKLYGVGFDGIYEIDLINQTHTLILDGPIPPVHRWRSGITCTKDTVLIFGERDLFTYKINTEELIHHGRIPNAISIWANLFWINGSLMGSANDQIVQIDLLNPSNSQIYCTLPQSGFLSLIQVAISCDSIAIFALHISGDIYLVNPVDCSTTYYCTIPHGINETFQGSTPTFMFMPPKPCSIYIDLDQQDLTLPGIDYMDTIYCSLPSKYLIYDLDLFSDKQWDSLVIWIEEGPPGVYLDGNSPSFASMTGQQTNHLKFYDTTLSDFSSLTSYVKDLILTGEMPKGISIVKIGFSAWAKNLVSDTAYAYITLIGRTNSAGEDDSIKLCLNDTLLFLANLLSSNTTPGGFWVPSTSQLNFFNPLNDVPGNYHYVVSDPFCEPDTANFLIETISQPDFDLGPIRLLCPGDTIQFSIDLSDVKFLWSDGSIQPYLNVIQPQIIKVEITDDFGCKYSDSTQVIIDESCIIDELYIPNIFSPDGNGINNEWFIEGNEGIQEMEVAIFDRWGNMIFHQKDASIKWKGVSKNDDLVPPGVYVYKLEILTIDNKTILRTGSLTLLR